jgi:membrane protein implicated in regulation of membrane protease activity
MRRIDVLIIGLVLFFLGGVGYFVLKLGGIDAVNAGIWSQVLFIFLVLGWLGTYLFRVYTKQMTYNQQLKDYEEAVLQKRLEELTPDQLALLQAEIANEEEKS